jgi:hypothetical protein
LLAKLEIAVENIKSLLFQVSFVAFNQIDEVSFKVALSSDPLDSLGCKLSDDISELKHLDSFEGILYPNK